MASIVSRAVQNLTYSYDGLGNLSRQTGARGCVLSLTYNLLNPLCTGGKQVNDKNIH